MRSDIALLTETMKDFTIIQGGMGVAISDWKLAKAVSSEGQLGVVSGTGIALIMIARLMGGDVGEHVRRALSHFPFQDSVKRILDTYFVREPKSPPEPYRRPPMWTLVPTKLLNELTVLANYVEVFLAKEGHSNPVGLNLLEKVQLPTMASLYGAMLAGVNNVIIGAGIPMQVPGILDKLAGHEAVSYRPDVIGAEEGDDFRIHFDPRTVFEGVADKVDQLVRPCFMPIVSSVVLAKALIKRATGKIDGIVVETSTAGGHNAPPRGPLQLDASGQPIYSQKDMVDLEQLSRLGLPFWVGGGYDSLEKLREVKAAGGSGIQVGTAFACCQESGMDPSIKSRLIQKVLNGGTGVRTDPLVSPTSFPFKVAQLENTLSESEVYQSRPRLCDIGMLRHLYKRADGSVGYRCPAEPEPPYVAKGGKAEDTEQRSCLCNNLGATAGYPQHRRDGYVEPAIVTIGSGLSGIRRYLNGGRGSYSAREVLEYLTRSD